MKTPKIYYGALAVFCITALGIGMASAGDGTYTIQGNTGTNGHGHPVFNLTDTTVQQHLLTRLEQQGIDVSALKTAFQNGDMVAVKTWFENYHQSHPFKMADRMSRDNSSS